MKALLFILFLVPISLFSQPPGNGMIFNGTSDYYTVTDNSSIDMNGSFTIESWINPCDTSTHAMILAKQWCRGGQFSYYFSINTGSLYWAWNTIGSCGGSATSSYQSNAKVIRNNIWQHVAVVHTPSNVSLFYNGVQVAGNLVAGSYSGNLHNSNAPLRAGVYRGLSGAYSNFFNGRMDEIRFWNVALTSTQISSRYNSALLGTESNLQLYHNFESVSGSVINNSCISTGATNNGNNITGSANIVANNSTYPLGFNLGNDTTFCQPNSTPISIPLGYSRYSWSDGFTNRNRVISNSGTYIGIGYKNFCFALDTISISVINCDSTTDTASPPVIDTCTEKFLMPNVFSPNNDGINEIFKPIYHDCFELLNFTIYNRWGQLLYESSKKIEWDGRAKNGKKVSEGSYFWIIQHKNQQGIESFEKGFLTVFND